MNQHPNITQRLRTMAQHTGLDAVAELLTEAAQVIESIDPGEIPDTLLAARARIEHLEAERDKLKTENTRILLRTGELYAEIEGLRSRISRMSKELEKHHAY